MTQQGVKLSHYNQYDLYFFIVVKIYIIFILTIHKCTQVLVCFALFSFTSKGLQFPFWFLLWPIGYLRVCDLISSYSWILQCSFCHWFLTSFHCSWRKYFVWYVFFSIFLSIFYIFSFYWDLFNGLTYDASRRRSHMHLRWMPGAAVGDSLCMSVQCD